MRARTGEEPDAVIEALESWLVEHEETVVGLKNKTVIPLGTNKEVQDLVEQWDVVHYWVYGEEIGDVE